MPSASLFSAYAEVFHVLQQSDTSLPSFLCLRRGVSFCSIGQRPRLSFSLPTQRCFWNASRDLLHRWLFSAYAEVFPRYKAFSQDQPAFLCLRRGVSIVAPFPAGTDYFSLPTQGCFNRRGDRHTVPSNFSLPTQRCFHHSLSYSIRSHLFSAYAEVFLGLLLRGRTPGTFLCLRRGVSVMPPGLFLFFTFSLPTQRCFRLRSTSSTDCELFSAYAEVFPTLRFFSTAVPAFLCLRRGVSTLHIVNHYTNSFSLPTQRCFH